MDLSLVYVAIISTVGGLIGLIIYQRGNLTNWALRMDYKKAEYDHKENLEKIRKNASYKLQTLKQATPASTEGLLGALKDLDLDTITDIVGKVEDLAGGTGEDSWLKSIINSPLLKGVVQGITKKKDEDEDEDTGAEGY